MKRPEFTSDEEKLIDHVRNHETTATQVWSFYGPAVVVATFLFAVGTHGNHLESELAGFAFVVLLLLRFVVYQTKPGWRIKPILDKYEEAFREK